MLGACFLRCWKENGDMTVGIASKLSPAPCPMHVSWHSSSQDLPLEWEAKMQCIQFWLKVLSAKEYEG